MLTFLQAVMPAQGNYVLSIGTLKTDGSGKNWFRNYHAATLQDLEQEARKFDASPDKTVFYALGSFKDNIHDDGKTGRTQAESHMFKTLAFDVDPKDSKQNVLYADQVAMVTTTRETCRKIGLPDPVFVSSGNGIHCYYPLTVEIHRDVWTRISRALRDALLATGMALDTSKVCDSSMVLRPVDTHNKKQSGAKLVRLLSKTVTLFDPLVLEQALLKFVKPSVPAKPAKKSGVAEAILSGGFPPAEASLVEMRCYHISVIAQTGGQVAEPLWHKAMGLAKHCVDPEVTAHRWSNQYTDYDPKEVAAKLAAWKVGPPTCKAFEAIDSAPCKACQHRGKITSPVQLGVSTVSDLVVLPAGGGMKLPKGYTIKGEKIIYTDSEGEAHFVSDYILYPSARFKDHGEGKSTATVECKLPIEGWKTFELTMDTLSKSAEFSLWLLNHQIFVHNEGTLTAMRKYMLTYMQELQQECASAQMSSSFGWTDDTCTEFVLGTRLIKKDRTDTVRLANLATDFSSALVSKGNVAEWAAKTAMFNEPGMQLHGLVFLMSVGSPLMVGSGLKSVLVNLYSEDSGTGKTTTGLYANSAYGNPERLKMTVKDTDNSLFKSMGVYGNLPVYIDEITEACHIPGRLGQIAYFITQGREKRRLDKSGGFQESVEWESISTSSSNKSIYAQLNDQSSYEGQTMRILQFPLTHSSLFPHGENNPFGYEMSHFLNKNYGHAGEDFVRGIITMGGPHKIFALARDQFTARYAFSFTGKERYWQAAMIIAFATGKLLKALGLSVVDYDACIHAGLDAIRALRRELNDEKMDCFDSLGLYMGENASKTVVFKKNTQRGTDGAVVDPVPHEAVARVEANCSNTNPFTSGRLFINAAHFNSWCHERGVDRRGMLAELQIYGVKVHKDRRIALMRGTEKPLPAVRVFEIELTHPRFVTIMQQTDLGIVNTGQLALVKGAAE